MTISKTMTNANLAKLLRAVSAALELTPGDNRFRIIAYDRAADSIEHASSEIKDLWDDGKLSDLSGVGESIASHLNELFTTGQVRHFNQILKKYPPALFELLEVPGLGPKNAYKLCKALGLVKAHTAISKLQKAAKSGQVAKIPGFGVDSQSSILRGLAEYVNRSKRLLLPAAEKSAQDIISWLKKIPEVISVDPLGSLRRLAPTVGDIDISVASNHPNRVITHFVSYPKKRRILEAGDHTASLILPNDHQVDLMVQPVASYGSLLQHFTGSKHHNIALREFALKKGLSLSEYGIKDIKSGKLHQFDSEQSFYKFLGLQYIPPELRENNGEIELATKNQMPNLINLSDITGDLQVHSDIDVQPSHDLGTSSLVEIARQAHLLGYQYIGLTEHNPSYSSHSQKQVIDLLKMKTNVIQSYNENNRENKIHFFNGLEIDILADGRLAVNDDCLNLLDYACVSIHSSFSQPRKIMTQRVLSGLDHPQVKFFAHPTARLLLEREGIELDWDVIFDFCVSHNKWLEIDAWPNRLDLPDNLVRSAIKYGVKLVIDTDSHSDSHLAYMHYGVSVARRGWATSGDIINTKSLTEVRQLFR